MRLSYDMQELLAMDHEILDDIIRKINTRFARKWRLAVICTAVPSAVKEQLKEDFEAAHPDIDFDKEWSKCFEEVTDDRFDPLVGTMAEVAGSC